MSYDFSKEILLYFIIFYLNNRIKIDGIKNFINNAYCFEFEKLFEFYQIFLNMHVSWSCNQFAFYFFDNF